MGQSPPRLRMTITTARLSNMLIGFISLQTMNMKSNISSIKTEYTPDRR